MTLEEAARTLGVDPRVLDPAPSAPRFSAIWAHMEPEPPCSACGRPSRTSGVLHDPQHGPRWLDRCRTCFIATPPTLRVGPAAVFADLRQVTTAAGVRLATYTDETGWPDETREP